MKNVLKFRRFIYLGLILFLSCNSKTINKTASDAPTIYIKQDQKETNTCFDQWIGDYEGSFLRLEGESADPRGWATVELKISKEKSTFYLFSYVEEKNYELEIIEEKDNSIIFRAKDSTINNKIHLRKKHNELEMESGFINNLVNKKQLIIMTSKNEK